MTLCSKFLSGIYQPLEKKSILNMMNDSIKKLTIKQSPFFISSIRSYCISTHHSTLHLNPKFIQAFQSQVDSIQSCHCSLCSHCQIVVLYQTDRCPQISYIYLSLRGLLDIYYLFTTLRSYVGVTVHLTFLIYTFLLSFFNPYKTILISKIINNFY